MNVSVGAYCGDDRPCIERIEARRAYAWPASQVSAQLQSGDECFVLRLDGCCVAYAFFQTVLDQSDLLLIVVDSDHRRHGLGNTLLTEAIKALATRGVVSVFLEVRESNTPAIALYDAMGFEVTGRRKGYYPMHGRESVTESYAAKGLAAKELREDALMMRYSIASL